MNLNYLTLQVINYKLNYKMASSSLRSDSQHWLIGKPISQLSTARLPHMLDVLQLPQFHHLTEGRTLPESYKMSCDAVICIWMQA